MPSTASFCPSTSVQRHALIAGAGLVGLVGLAALEALRGRLLVITTESTARAVGAGIRGLVHDFQPGMRPAA